MIHSAYLSLGSNIGDSKETLKQAILSLNAKDQITVTHVASNYQTTPVGGVKQDDFVNTAVRVKTELSPEELLDRCHEVEQSFHRERLIHWGPRTLDIDIIFFDEVTQATDTLILPHKEAFNRLFVLVPVLEIYQEDAYRTQIEAAIQKITNDPENTQRIERISHG
ncbi:2-amino-4-hydroxy-6-hydroxymethyldihydropteridine diphosphokinase [Aerococcus vaginalis]